MSGKNIQETSMRSQIGWSVVSIGEAALEFYGYVLSKDPNLLQMGLDSSFATILNIVPPVFSYLFSYNPRIILQKFRPMARNRYGWMTNGVNFVMDLAYMKSSNSLMYRLLPASHLFYTFSNVFEFYIRKKDLKNFVNEKREAELSPLDGLSVEEILKKIENKEVLSEALLADRIVEETGRKYSEKTGKILSKIIVPYLREDTMKILESVSSKGLSEIKTSAEYKRIIGITNGIPMYSIQI